MRTAKIHLTPEDQAIADRLSIHATCNYIVGDHNDARRLHWLERVKMGMRWGYTERECPAARRVVA